MDSSLPDSSVHGILQARIIIMVMLQLVGDGVSLQNTKNMGNQVWREKPLLLTDPKYEDRSAASSTTRIQASLRLCRGCLLRERGLSGLSSNQFSPVLPLFTSPLLDHLARVQPQCGWDEAPCPLLTSGKICPENLSPESSWNTLMTRLLCRSAVSNSLQPKGL